MSTMTLQPRPHNPIEQRKLAVRKYSRRAVISVAGGVGGGIVLGLLSGSFFTIFILCSLIGIAAGFFNWRKVQEIVNHKDY